jgi:hypothetical protein
VPIDTSTGTQDHTDGNDLPMSRGRIYRTTAYAIVMGAVAIGGARALGRVVSSINDSAGRLTIPVEIVAAIGICILAGCVSDRVLNLFERGGDMTAADGAAREDAAPEPH